MTITIDFLSFGAGAVFGAVCLLLFFGYLAATTSYGPWR